MITSAGYRIGPFDVESALLEHEAVAESAVVGKPDEERGEIVKAFVVLKPGREGDAALTADLKEKVRKRLGKHAYPPQIAFVASLPKTPSGKIQRFVLRNTSPHSEEAPDDEEANGAADVCAAASDERAGQTERRSDH